MKPPSNHLLRTLAAVPVSSRVLDLGCGTGRHTEPLLRLGFPVHACDAREHAVQKTRTRIEELVGAETAAQCVQVVAPDAFDVYPDDAFDWIIAFAPASYLQSPGDLPAVLDVARRLLRPGGWVYVALPAEQKVATNGTVAAEQPVTPAWIEGCADNAGLAVSVAPEQAEEHGESLVRAIFRYVTEETPI